MNKRKPNYKAMAVCWFISGVLSIIFGIIFLGQLDDAQAYSRKEREAKDMGKGVCVLFIVSGACEIIGSMFCAHKASQESENNNNSLYNNQNINNNGNYNQPNAGSSWNNPVYNANYVTQGGFWICPKCRRENADYVGTCGCGERKPSIVIEESHKKAVEEAEARKFCPYCGEKVSIGQAFCRSCGGKL